MDAYLTPSSFGTGPQSSGAGREGWQGHLEGPSPPPGPQGGRSAEPLAPQNQCFLLLSLVSDPGFSFLFFPLLSHS